MDENEAARADRTQTVAPRSRPPFPPTQSAAGSPALNQPGSGQPGSGQSGSGDLRFGPGVPASPPAAAPGWPAEGVQRTGRPPARRRRLRRLRRLAGPLLTVVLLAASGTVLFLRFHHAPLRVTSVVISQTVPSACGAQVTARVATNGGAGTVAYQWVVQLGKQPPVPQYQTVTAGQDAVYLNDVVAGSGHGSVQVKVTLEVLGPDKGTASAVVPLRC